MQRGITVSCNISKVQGLHKVMTWILSVVLGVIRQLALHDDPFGRTIRILITNLNLLN